MKRLVVFLSVFFMSTSFLLFSSRYMYDLFFPYPYFFFLWALIWLVLLGLVVKNYKYINLDQGGVFMALLFVACAGVLVATMRGDISILSTGSKILTVALSGLSLWMGSKVQKTASLFREFSVFLFFISVPIVAYSWIDINLNNNWAAILLGFSIVALLVSGSGEEKHAIVSSLAVIALSLFVFKARGVALSFIVLAACSSLVWAVKWFSLKSASRLSVFLVFWIFFSTLALPFFGIELFRSEHYSSLNAASIEYFGKSLSSSRLERWAPAYDLVKESPVFGYGIDAALPRVSDSEGGALHNFWLEVVFRFGLFGVLVYLLLMVFVISRLLHKSEPFKVLVVFSVFCVQMSVYGVGGFTHWPGTFGYWFLFGVLLAGNGSGRIKRLGRVYAS